MADDDEVERFLKLGSQPGHVAESRRRDPTAGKPQIGAALGTVSADLIRAETRIAELEVDLSEARAAADFMRRACTCARVSQSDIDRAVETAQAIDPEVL